MSTSHARRDRPRRRAPDTSGARSPNLVLVQSPPSPVVSRPRRSFASTPTGMRRPRSSASTTGAVGNEVGERRQIGERIDAEPLEEHARRGEQRGIARRRLVTALLHIAALHERLQRRVDVHAADRARSGPVRSVACTRRSRASRAPGPDEARGLALRARNARRRAPAIGMGLEAIAARDASDRERPARHGRTPTRELRAQPPRPCASGHLDELREHAGVRPARWPTSRIASDRPQ